MNKTGRCGNCANYRRMLNHEDICRKTGKVVPWMAIRECYEESINTEQKTTTMEQSNNVTNEQTNNVTNNVTPTTKVCKDCGRELPLDSFGKSFRSSDGYSHICRECKGKRLKAGKEKASETDESQVMKLHLEGMEKKEKELKDIMARASKNSNRVNGIIRDMIDAGVEVHDDGTMSIPLEEAAERARKSISGALDHELVDELRARGWEVSCKRTMVIKL